MKIARGKARNRATCDPYFILIIIDEAFSFIEVNEIAETQCYLGAQYLHYRYCVLLLIASLRLNGT